MTVLYESISIERPLKEVFAYAANFANCAEWDSTAFESTKTSPGPLGVGSTFDVRCKVSLGSIKLQYRITDWQPDKSVTLVGECSWFTVTDVISFSYQNHKTTVDYTATFDYKIQVDKAHCLSTFQR